MQQLPQEQVVNITTYSTPTYPVAQPIQQTEKWWKGNNKYKPQLNSIGPASLIFISGGINMAWKLGLSTTFNTEFMITERMVSSWFEGAVFSAIGGAFFSKYFPKKLLMWMSSILVVIGGILQVSDPNTYDIILASRYLNGIAVGFIFPMTFVMIGEEVVKPLRGLNSSVVDTMSFSCGIFIQILYSVLWTSEAENVFKAIQMGGLLNIICGIIAFIMTTIYMVESPIFYLVRGDEQMALDSLIRLQRPHDLNAETCEELEEHKHYVAQSNERTFKENAFYAIPALLKLCFYRSFAVLGFSYFVNFAFSYSSLVTTQLQIYPYILYALARLLGPIIASFTLDSKGRKPSMIIGFFICTILAFTVGGIFDNKQNFIDFDYMTIVKYFLICFQLFSSMSMASSSAYLCEAFPLPVKRHYIAIVFIVEMMVHIIINTFKNTFLPYNVNRISDYFLSLGGLSLVFLGVAIFAMPETKWCSLRECLPKFRQLYNFRK
ncbi:uncharacterized protein LOC135954550 [Calliphora vicina]|uniref:uncharacterized protein LOC135954550 n=1 Tax=Calliphora vicina TaxID=7373 RepID=UPI00325B8A04